MRLQTLSLVSCSLLIAAGCTQEREYARYDHISTYPAYSSGSTIYTDSSQGGTQHQTNSGATAQTAATAGSQTGVLVTEVRQALVRDAELAPVASNLQISSEGGTITLQGTVNSEEQKQQVENVVMQTAGVTRVDNQIQVASQAAGLSATSDAGRAYSSSTNQLQGSDQLQATSRTNQWSAQSQSGLTQSDTNEAQTSEGQMLEPTGSTSSTNTYQGSSTTGSSSSTNAYQGLSATGSSTNAAQGLSQTGTSGESGIKVMVQGTSASDQTLSQQLTQALRADTTLAGSLSGVRIEIEDGNVTLRGSVRSDQQKEAIESAVQRVPGVSSVENQLQVGTSTQTTPLNQ